MYVFAEFGMGALVSENAFIAHKNVKIVTALIEAEPVKV